MADSNSAMDNREEKEPSLVWEILAVALSLLKFLFAIGVPLAVIVFVLRNHPVVLMGTIYALLFIGMIAMFGYQNYRWKKQDFERQRRSKEEGIRRGGETRKGTNSGNGAR